MDDEIQAIEREQAEFEEQRRQILDQIRSLQAEEDPVGGVFRAEEIHAAKQEKLRLDFEIMYRKARVKRIRFGG